MSILTSRTRLLGLLGHPVSHSRSPELHNAALQALGLPFAYLAFDVVPERIEGAIAGLRALGARGVNVTIPHKESVLAYADIHDATVLGTGAANTLVFDETHTVAYNTDVAGFWAGLAPYAARCRGQRALVLGSGGAARAVAWALLHYLHPAALTLAVRTSSRAMRLLDDLAPFAGTTALNVVSLDACREAMHTSTLVVNTTPVGMYPNVDATPYAHPEDFGAHHVVYDLIYRPAPTRLLREASNAGATCIDGLPMFVGQAEAAFTLWTGASFPARIVETFMARLSA